MHDLDTSPPRGALADGDMATRIRFHDWSATPLGPAAGWPTVFRTAVASMLSTDVPMAALLGSDLVQVHNDGYRRVMGRSHPGGLGLPAREGRRRDASVLARVLAGETVTVEEGPHPDGQGGTGLRLSHQPLRDEAGGVVGVTITVSAAPRALWAEAGRPASPPNDGSAGDRALADEVARLRGALEDQARAARDQDAVIRRLRDSESRLAADLAAARELQRVGSELVGDRDPEALYRRIVEAAATLAGAEAASLRALRPDENGVELLAACGFPPDGAPPRWLPAEGMRGEEGAPEAGCRPAFPPLRSTTLRARDGEAVGLLSTFHRGGRTPSETQTRSLDALARMAAALIGRLWAGERLRQAEERFRRFGDASPDVLWIRNARTLRCEYLSAGFAAIYGLPVAEGLAGEGVRSWIARVVEEDRAGVLAGIDRIRAGERAVLEYRIRRPDGELRWLRNTDFPMAAPDGTVGLIGGVEQDITELRRIEASLREGEARMRTLMEGIPQLVWRSAGEGRWTWAGQQWLDFTGQAQDETHGLGWLRAVHPEDRERTLRAWAEAEGAQGLDVEHRLRLAEDGAYLWHHTRAAPVRDAEGRTVEWLGTSTDIDELRSLKDRQGVLVAELQHRTRNLMGVVRSMSDKTARASTDLDDFRENFRDRLDALARVQGLLSRLSEHDRVTFDELMGAEMSALSDSADRVTLDGPRDVRLRSSTVQTLAMALHELATNAVKYGALGQPGGRLAVTWRVGSAGAEGAPWLHIDWRESGIAVPDDGAGGAARGGQGRELIERALPYQLGARTSYAVDADGVHCSISLPVSATHAIPE